MKLKHVALDYFPEFKCLADKCNYSCCTGWRVGLTRQEYMKTKNLRTTKQLAETIKISMKRTKSETEKFYAFMQMKENGDCPFLTENKLCALQLEHGYNVLSNTCKVFPRLQRVSPVQWEEYCTIGCEQVVNLLLQRPQGLRLIEIDDGKTATIDDDFLEQVLQKDPRFHFYKELQMLFIGILQNRSYSLSHRMILLGLAARDLDKATTKEETISFIRKSLPLLKHSPEMEAQLNAMQANPKEGLQNALIPTIGKLMNMSDNSKAKDLYLKKAIESISKNIKAEYSGEQNELTVTVEVQNYLELQPHFNSLEYAPSLLENVMVNMMFQRQFPLVWNKENLSVWEEYLLLFAEYNTLKVLATAYMAGKNDPSDLVHIITVCGRMMMHNDQFCKNLVEMLHRKEQDTLAHIAMMLCC